jgi:hypothetical protein
MPTLTTAEALKQRFSGSHIAKAAIVDDIFDGLTAEALAQRLTTFVDVLADGDHLAELQKLMPEIAEADAFGIDAAKMLWEKQAQWPVKIVPLANELFAEHGKKLARLKALRASLEKIGLEVREFGANLTKYDALAEVQILFLDYQLEPPASAAQAESAASAGAQVGRTIQTAQTKAEKIATQLAGGKKRPFLVLISAMSDLAEVQAGFRERTNYVGGTFGFLEKDEASDEPNLYYHIRRWGIGHPALPVITDFIAKLQKSATTVAEEFGRTLLKLEVQDYSFIQRLSLAADGEPLGEYMLHLISESLSHRLRNDPAVIAARQELDKIHFENHLPSIVKPSDTVSRLYMEALTDRGPEALAPHPLQSAQQPPPATVYPRVMQGDVFLSPCKTYAYVVANCGCALQFSPVNPNRLANPETMLLLLKGTLKLFSEDPGKLGFLRTEPFLIDDLSYRILWDPELVKPISRADFTDWCQSKGFKRIARLREVQAAAIQQAWAATMARIGLPVAPPSFSSADYEIYVEKNGKYERTGSRVADQVILTEHVEDRELVHSFTLTPKGVQELAPGFLAASVAMRDALVKNPPSGPHAEDRKQGLQTAIDETARYATDSGDLFMLMEKEHVMKREPGKAWKAPAGAVPICFMWQAKLQGKATTEFKLPGKATVIVNILPPGAAAPPPPAEGPAPPQGEPPPAAAAETPVAKGTGRSEGAPSSGLCPAPAREQIEIVKEHVTTPRAANMPTPDAPKAG